MIKKFALLAAAAGLLFVAAPSAPASAQGISVRVGGGHHGWHRDHGWRRSHADFGRHHGWDRRGRGHKTVIIRR